MLQYLLNSHSWDNLHTGVVDDFPYLDSVSVILPNAETSFSTVKLINPDLRSATASEELSSLAIVSPENWVACISWADLHFFPCLVHQSLASCTWSHDVSLGTRRSTIKWPCYIRYGLSKLCLKSKEGRSAGRGPGTGEWALPEFTQAARRCKAKYRYVRTLTIFELHSIHSGDAS